MRVFAAKRRGSSAGLEVIAVGSRCESLSVERMAFRIPAAPEVIPRLGTPLRGWAPVASALERERAQHKAASDFSREIGKATRLAALHFQLGELGAAQAAYERAADALAAVPREVGFDARTRQRSWPLRESGESVAVVRSTLEFVTLGRFPALEAGPEEAADDDLDAEYVGGLLGAAQELVRYATRRATSGDAASVAVCRDGVLKLHEALLEFDFRNGPLRRKFDGLKYALRRLEDVLYEQSLAGRGGGSVDDDSAATEKDDAVAPPCLASLAEVKGRMDASDAARERVIKLSRDVQKGAKQAIFACHRGDDAKAGALLGAATKAAEAILAAPDLVARWPQLRHGSLSNALEEWAEAALFAHWLKHDGEVAAPEALGLPLSEEEYLGGVCDLTGEIGRVAVAAATKRDLDRVKVVYATDVAVLEQLAVLPLPPKLTKKIDPLSQAVKKIEAILYELALNGGKRPLSSADDPPPPKRDRPGGDDDDDDGA